MNDPVFKIEVEETDGGELMIPGWYFWDETWASSYGPFETEEEARTRLSEYIRYNLG